MITINNGLGQPKWSVAVGSTDSLGTKRSRTISGINLVKINFSAATADSQVPTYPVSPATGYTAAEVLGFAQALVAMLGDTYESCALNGKFALI